MSFVYLSSIDFFIERMKAFWRNLLASFIAVVLGGVFVLFLAFIIITSAFDKEAPKVEEGSMLVVKLKGEMQERTPKSPFAALVGDDESVAYNKIMWCLKAAKTDDKIKGVVLHIDLPSMGVAQVEDIRQAILDFRKSKKFVYAYAEVYDHRSYYLASAADRIYMPPTGYVEWTGLASTPMFVKGTLEKLEIEPVLFRVGEYKSAGEMFIRKDLSEENRAQLKEYLNDVWRHWLKNIAASRKLNADTLSSLAGSLQISHAKTAKKAGMVDKLAYMDQLLEDLKSVVKTDEKGIPNQIEINRYYETLKPGKGEHKIAIVYANGGIDGGKGDEENIGSEGMARLLRRLRRDEDVKAVVLRVNSPGGGALASDVIAREVELLRKEKPVVASYGNVAASGGYYISAGCSRIFAQPTTLTGSIGVFGMWANLQPMMNRHLGITFDRVTTDGTPYGDVGNVMRPLNDLERARIQQNVDAIYQEFITVVKKGRGFASLQDVDRLARGRIYSGQDAKDLKLVDELGGMFDALNWVAKKAGLGDEYRVVEYPEMEDPIQKLLGGATGQDQARVALMEQFVGKRHMQLLMSFYRMHQHYPAAVYMHTGLDIDIR